MQPMRQEQFAEAVRRVESLRAAKRMGRHAALALVAVAAFALCGLALVGRGIDARNVLVARDDPVKLSDLALARHFDRAVAEREMRAALAAKDTDLARSFLELARDRGITVDADLAERVKAADAEAHSATHVAGSFARGFFTGEPDDLVSLAGTATGDLFVFGDIRDAVREGTRLATGQKADKLILGLACVGLAITAGTYATVGLGTPARIGLSVVKAARRTGRLGARLGGWVGRALRRVIDWGALSRAAKASDPVMAVRAARDVVKVGETGELMGLVGDVGRIERKAGTQAAFESLQVAESPADMSRLARLAAAKGGKTRAIIKLLGRAAIVLTASAFELSLWLVWGAFTLFGVVCSLKTMVERMTWRHIHRRKARLARQLECRAAEAVASLMRRPVLTRTG